MIWILTTIYPTCILISTVLMSMNIRNTFIYLQNNILSPSRITIILYFYFRNIYHTKQPRLLTFHWPEPNNQYIFFSLFFFLFSFLFSLSLSLFFKYLSHEATQAAFFSLARAEQPIYFFISFLFYSTNHHNFSSTKFDMSLKSTSHRV